MSDVSTQQEATATPETTQSVDLVEAAIKAVDGAKGEPAVESAPAETPASEPKGEQPQGENKPKHDIESLLSKDRQVSAQKRQQAQQKPPSIDDLKAKAAENPDEVLKELGLDPATLAVKWLTGDQKAAEAAPADEGEDDPRIAALKQELAEIKGTLTQRQQAELEAQQRELANKAVSNAKGFLSEHADKYPILANSEAGSQMLLDALVAVYEDQRDYYETHGTAPDFSEIAEGVEQYALKQLKQQIEWATKQDKLKPIIKEALGIKSDVPRSSSLDNSLTAERAEAEGDLSEEDRVKLAIRAVEQASQQDK